MIESQVDEGLALVDLIEPNEVKWHQLIPVCARTYTQTVSMTHHENHLRAAQVIVIGGKGMRSNSSQITVPN